MTDVYIVDAFHEGQGSGNPAGVVLLEGQADEAWLRAVAAELNQAATAFVGPAIAGRYPLRWFSPTTELQLCGHGTLAAGRVLAATTPAERFDFDTRGGALSAEVDGSRVVLDFPAPPVGYASPPPGLLDALGVAGTRVASSGHMVIVEVGSPDDVAACDPDLGAAAFAETRTAVVTSSGGDGSDITSRVFAPGVGILEDHATGSAHCALAVFWADRLGTRLSCHQSSPRGARIEVTLDGDRVLLGGAADIVVGGRWLSEPS